MERNMTAKKYAVHLFSKRKWYVENFLIPSMIEQGIKKDDIIVFEDDGAKGNLMSFVCSMDYIANAFNDETAIWHLQDDIIIGNNFAEVSEMMNPKYIACGFVNEHVDSPRIHKIGWQSTRDCWFSFQAIQIPNRYARPFVEWFEKEVIGKGKFKKMFELRKYDDYIFRSFLKGEYANDLVYNICPNIVNHVDEIVGDSVCNPHLIGRNMSYYWRDNESIEILKKKVMKFRRVI